MKKRNCRLLALGVAIGMMYAISLNTLAWDYNLDITYPYAGSLKSTMLYKKESGTTPYVHPNKVTISTTYFLSPTRLSGIMATELISTAGTGESKFSWREGYGGVGQNYCLSAYPTQVANYDAYNVSGTWSN